MKRSKLQTPSSRETSISKLQDPSAEGLVWFKHAFRDDEMVLRDEPRKRPDDRHPFDLEERTAIFGEKIVRFSKRIPRNPTNDRLIDQLIGCGTSVGANYREANEGVSKKDFRHPLSRCVKEAKETKFFLRMVVASEPQLATEARELYREATELVLIFATMYRK